jgi:diguanylate cyclase (GGDEF)-like protein/PAS domain S-box-containing protein
MAGGKGSSVERLAAVQGAVREIIGAVTEDAVLVAVREAAGALLCGETAIVIELDETGWPESAAISGEARVRYNDAVIQRACRTSGAVVIAESDLRVPASDGAKVGRMRSALCAPIFVRGRATACLYVIDDPFAGPFATEQTHLAGFIAALAGAALEQAARVSEQQAGSTPFERGVADLTVHRSGSDLRAEEAQSARGVGTWEWDGVADTIQWSNELGRIYGVESDSHRSLDEFLVLVHADDRARTQTAYHADQQISLEHRIVRADGTVRVIRVRGDAIMGDGGQRSGMRGTAQDVTACNAAEDALAGLAALVDCSEDAIITKTSEGVITSWNRGAQELFGYTAGEAVGRPIAIIVPAERRRELSRIMAQINGRERIEPLETVRLTKSGRAIEVSLRVSLIYGATGQLLGASAISRDITRQKFLEAKLRRTSRYFELSRDLTLTADIDGNYMSVNPAVEQILGWSVAEFLASSPIDMVHPDDRTATLSEQSKLMAGQSRSSFVNRHLAKDGSYHWLDWSTILAPDESVVYASARDITDRREIETALHMAEQRFRTTFDRAPVGVCLLSLDPGEPGRLLQVNPALAELLGRSVEELTGAPLSLLTHPEDHDDTYARLREVTQSHSGRVEFEKRLMHGAGHPVWVLISAAALPESSAGPAQAVTHIIDISDRKRAEAQLQHLAYHDGLTGLYNRQRFTEELERSLRQAKRFDETGAVLLLDLDGFKSVNDTLGHPAGDELISAVAGRLSSALRETDMFARLGGDEFAVLFTRCDETSAVLIAEKLLSTLRRDDVFNSIEARVHVSSSIGIAMFSGHENMRAEELVVEAEIAMYEAKQAGKDRYAVFDREDGRRGLLALRESWEQRLRRALSDDSFLLYAQPITAICANGAPKFELLLRLPDEHGDLIPPASFLYHAERAGLIEPIDHWVLEQAVRHLHQSHAVGHDLILSVNVSGETMGQPGLDTHLAELLSRYPIPPESLMVEITETAAIKNLECARFLAQELSEQGCKIALDDFGAGFASFYYLKRLHFDCLKIDGEYIRNLCDSSTDQLVVKAIVTIARGLGTSTIAEFVGDDATIDRLKELGVDYGQGFHLGRPAPLDQSLPYLSLVPPSDAGGSARV